MELHVTSMTGQRINFVTLTCVEIADSDLHLALPERVIAGLNKSLAGDTISGRSWIFMKFYLKIVLCSRQKNPTSKNHIGGVSDRQKCDFGGVLGIEPEGPKKRKPDR